MDFAYPASEASPLPAIAGGAMTVSVDVEDWHQLVTRRMSGVLPECSSNVADQMKRVLDVFDQHGIRGTFFVLGLVAQGKPELVREIAARGHEIASHGISHVPLHLLDRARVRAELRDSRQLLSDLTGADVAGFRAPEFSIGESNIWVLEEIAEAGYRYDSSIFPIRHRRYGIASFARGPVELTLPGGKLWELPLATLRAAGRNLPVGGGGYFRLLPGAALKRVFRSLASDGDYSLLYFHPYEFAPENLRVDDDVLPSGLPGRARARVWFALQAMGRPRLPGRLERVLREARCIRCIDLIDQLQASNQHARERIQNGIH